MRNKSTSGPVWALGDIRVTFCAYCLCMLFGNNVIENLVNSWKILLCRYVTVGDRMLCFKYNLSNNEPMIP